MGQLTKQLIGKEDLSIQYNTNDPEQFSRLNSVGGTINLYQIPDIWTGTGRINVGLIEDVITKGPWVDVRAYGAVGDGVTDDTAAIRVAIDSLTTGTVIIPIGSFKTTSAIIPKSGVNIIGLSQIGSKILPNGNFAAIDIADDASKSGFIISGFTIDYGSTSMNPLAIGIKISSSATYYACDFLIDNLYIKNAYNTIYDASGSWNYKIQKVTGYATGGTAFYIYAYGTAAKTLVTLDQCYVGGNCGAGFALSGIQSLRMNSCSVDNSLTKPMYFTTCNGEISVSHIEGNNISGNILDISGGNLILNGCWFSGNTINASAAEQRSLIHASSGTIVTLQDCKDNGNLMTGNGTQYVFSLSADSTSRIISVNSQWTAFTGTGSYLFCDNYVNHNVEVRDNDIGTLANSATPSVVGHDKWITGGTTTITDFANGYRGQELTIISEHAITITDGTNIFLNGSANFVMAATGTLTLIQKTDGKWYELGRSVN